MSKKEYRFQLLVLFFAGILVCTVSALVSTRQAAAEDEVQWTADQKPLADQLDAVRGLDDHARAAAIPELAQKIQRLPVSKNKLRLALNLAGKSTEGDLGTSAIQAAATALASSLSEKPVPWTAPSESGSDIFSDSLFPYYGYSELAQLERYEHIVVSLSGDLHYQAAKAALEVSDAKRAHLDFALSDPSGKTWRLSALHGQVVLVNFWATWCPPCRKEIPDLENLYKRFSSQGFVVLGITDEDAAKIDTFLKAHPISYHVLLDSNRAINKEFAIQGIPKSFVYDRSGKLVSEAIDMRTEQQLLKMLQAAGLN